MVKSSFDITNKSTNLILVKHWKAVYLMRISTGKLKAIISSRWFMFWKTRDTSADANTTLNKHTQWLITYRHILEGVTGVSLILSEIFSSVILKTLFYIQQLQTPTLSLHPAPGRTWKLLLNQSRGLWRNFVYANSLFPELQTRRLRVT